MSAYNFTIKQNDRRPNLTAMFKNADGTPLDLTTAVSVTFVMRLRTTLKIDHVACVITDAANGTVEYEWQDGDTDTVATYKGEFEITWATGVVQTFPADDYIKIIVKDDL